MVMLVMLVVVVVDALEPLDQYTTFASCASTPTNVGAPLPGLLLSLLLSRFLSFFLASIHTDCSSTTWPTCSPTPPREKGRYDGNGLSGGQRLEEGNIPLSRIFRTHSQTMWKKSSSLSVVRILWKRQKRKIMILNENLANLDSLWKFLPLILEKIQNLQIVSISHSKRLLYIVHIRVHPRYDTLAHLIRFYYKSYYRDALFQFHKPLSCLSQIERE